MSTKSMFLASYSIGEDPYDKVVEICSKYGKKIVFICGKTALSKAADLVKHAIKGLSLIHI